MATYYRRPYIENKTGLKKLGNYYIQWYENGKLKKESTGIKNFKEFDAYYEKWKKNRKARSSGNIMLSEFMQEVFSHVKSNLPESLNVYKECLGNFLKIIKDKPVKLIALQDIEKFKAERLLMKSKKYKDKFITKTTVNKELRTIKSAFNKAVDEFGLLEEHKIVKAKLFRIPKSNERKRLTQEEKINVNEIQHEMAKRAAEIGLVTGMRLNEICFFQLSDIKILKYRKEQTGESCEQAIIQIRNKPEIGFKVKAGKERDIPINNELLSKIKTWMNYLTEENITTMVNPDSFIINHSGGKRYKKGSLSRRVSLWMNKVNIDGTLHNCRHTFASELLENNTDIESVRDLLGHSNITTTAIYVHSIDETKISAVNKLKMN